MVAPYHSFTQRSVVVSRIEDRSDAGQASGAHPAGGWIAQAINFINYRTYAVALSNATLPAAAWYFPTDFRFFALRAKKRTTKRRSSTAANDHIWALRNPC
jgi:hypothetical protein